MLKTTLLRIGIAMLITMFVLPYGVFASDDEVYATYTMRITDPAYVPNVAATTEPLEKPGDVSFTVYSSTLNEIKDKYDIRQFRKAYPNSPDVDKEDIYFIEVNDPAFLYELETFDNTVFTAIEEETFTTYYIPIDDIDYVPNVEYINFHAELSFFPHEDLNNIASEYLVKQFHQAYPNSTNTAQLKIYLVTVNNDGFLQGLQDFNNTVFGAIEERVMYSYYLTVTNHAYAPAFVSTYTNPSVLLFPDSYLTNLAAQYDIQKFYAPFYFSGYGHLRNTYYVSVNSPTFISSLLAYNNAIYPHAELLPGLVIDCFTPDDYGKQFSGKQPELDLINAKGAWDISKGDKHFDNDPVDEITIGMVDKYTHTGHTELLGKIATNYGNQATVAKYHGTAVAGVLAGRTHNNDGLSSIGFNAKLAIYSYSDNLATGGIEEPDALMLKMSNDNIRILNASWTYAESHTAGNLNLTMRPLNQDLYNEIYDNGSIAVFGAGNGDAPTLGPTLLPSSYCFPASYDHNISVTSVGSVKAADAVPYNPGSSIYYNIEDVHSYYAQKTNNSPVTWSSVAPPGGIPVGGTVHNYNDRIDICAPGWSVGLLNYDPANLGNKYFHASGTSIATPLVSGTVALMLDANPCLSPYQVEFLLKNFGAEASIYSIPANAPYTGKLGKGRLKAYDAVSAALGYDCNKAESRTMFIPRIDITHKCLTMTPKPKLKVTVVNGNGDYDYRWLPIGENTAQISSQTDAEPSITSSTTNTAGKDIFYYSVTVTEKNKAIPMVANARVRIELQKNGGYDLAMQDNYMDMYNQENDMKEVDKKYWNLWISPDLWNRQTNDYIEENEDPEYFISDPNFVNFRIKNVGCAASPSSGAKIRLYWTLASSGEKWAADWTTRTVLGSDATTQRPAGLEIPTNGGITIPSLQPGGVYTSSKDWYPPKPEDYYDEAQTKKMGLCLLARIEEQGVTNLGMFKPEVVSTKDNVKANNNIATRNLILTNFNTANKKTSVNRLYVANGSGSTTTYALSIVNDKDIFRALSGDLSAYLYAVIHLGDLYDRWQLGGGLGNAAIVDAVNKTVTYDPAVALRLENIELDPNDFFPVDIEFKLRDSISVPDTFETMIHFRQLHMEEAPFQRDPENPVYVEEEMGNVSYHIVIEADSIGQEKRNTEEALRIEDKERLFAIYPNPVSEILTIVSLNNDKHIRDLMVTDITGRMIVSESNIALVNSRYNINTSSLMPGIYFARITDDAGKTVLMKFVKSN